MKFASRAALATSAFLFVVALARALLLSPPPAPLAPLAGENPALPERKTIPEARLARTIDPFRSPPAPTPAEPAAAARPQQEPLRLKGIIPMPAGGLAVVESDAHGSRLMRIGDEWSGLRLREVGVGRAVFADTATGKSIVINMRKTGT
jgi:hypothetical protein